MWDLPIEDEGRWVSSHCMKEKQTRRNCVWIKMFTWTVGKMSITVNVVILWWV